ncbi:MAG: MoaD/ThiS family protein [Roseiarcus sp.]
MTGTIEVRAFMQLSTLFAARGWSNPRTLEVENGVTGGQLLAALGVDTRDVESLIVNRRAVPVEGAVLKAGDRVALVPPGAPGPHRLLLGLRDMSAPRKM